MRKSLKHWIPAICVAVLISIFSTHYFSGAETARFLIPLLQRLFPAAGPHTLNLIHTGIRKVAHITEFGVLSISVFHGIRGERYGWRFQWALITLIIAVSYAGLDEWHQSFVPVREARFRDVLIDSTGALLAQVLVWVYAKLHRNLVQSPALKEKTP
jgi:VanZ family protein